MTTITIYYARHTLSVPVSVANALGLKDGQRVEADQVNRIVAESARYRAGVWLGQLGEQR